MNIKTLSMLSAIAVLTTSFSCKPYSEKKDDLDPDDALVQNLMKDVSGLYLDSQVATNYVNKAKNLFTKIGIPFDNWQIRYGIYPKQERLDCTLVLPTNEVPQYLSKISPDFCPRIKINPFRPMVWTGQKPKTPLPPRHVLSFELSSEQDGFEVSPWLKPSENDVYNVSFIGRHPSFPTPTVSKNKQSFSECPNQYYYFLEYPKASLTISQNSCPKNLTHISITKDINAPTQTKKDYWCVRTPKELMDRVAAQKSLVFTDAPFLPLDEKELDLQIDSSKGIKRQIENRFHHVERNVPIHYTEMKYTVYGFEHGYDPLRTFITYKIPTDKGETFRYFEMNLPQEKTPHNVGENRIGSFTEISPEEYDKKTNQAKKNSWITLSARRSIDGTTSISVEGNTPRSRYNHYKKMSMSYNLQKSKKWNLVITEVPYEAFGFSAEREIQMTFDGDSRISCKEHYPSSREIRLFSDKKSKEIFFIKQKDGRN